MLAIVRPPSVRVVPCVPQSTWTDTKVRGKVVRGICRESTES